jgi:DNA-binding response OmpR family regulator
MLIASLMYRVLIVTDDQRLAGPLGGALAGANVICAVVGTDLERIGEALAKGGPDAVILDGRSGAALDPLVRTIREQPGLEEVPMVGILPQAALSDLPLPALDDFVLDSSPTPELVARVLSRLAKSRPPGSGNVVRAGALEVDIDNYKAKLGRHTLDLTYKEFELLRFLATHRGRVFTREALLNRVWGYDYFGGARTVDVHIRRLRAKLGSCQSLIETVRSVGYRFSED